MPMSISDGSPSVSIPRDARIVIVGVGPSGLAKRYFLREHGCRNETILERHQRVGGRCRTVT